MQLFWQFVNVTRDGHIELPRCIPCLHAMDHTVKRNLQHNYSAYVSHCWSWIQCMCAIAVSLVLLLCCRLLRRARTGQSAGTASPRKGVEEKEGRRRQLDTWTDQGTGSLRWTAFAYFIFAAFCYSLLHTIDILDCICVLNFVNKICKWMLINFSFTLKLNVIMLRVCKSLFSLMHYRYRLKCVAISTWIRLSILIVSGPKLLAQWPILSGEFWNRRVTTP